jgi:hypothetical protein
VQHFSDYLKRMYDVQHACKMLLAYTQHGNRRRAVLKRSTLLGETFALQLGASHLEMAAADVWHIQIRAVVLAAASQTTHNHLFIAPYLVFDFFIDRLNVHRKKVPILRSSILRFALSKDLR